jgi:hypothetical protein
MSIVKIVSMVLMGVVASGSVSAEEIETFGPNSVVSDECSIAKIVTIHSETVRVAEALLGVCPDIDLPNPRTFYIDMSQNSCGETIYRSGYRELLVIDKRNSTCAKVEDRVVEVGEIDYGHFWNWTYSRSGT